MVNIIFRRKKLSSLLDNVDGLPEKWRMRSQAEIISLVNAYDFERDGHLKWPAFLSFLTLESQLSQIDEITKLIREKASREILEEWEKELASKNIKS